MILRRTADHGASRHLVVGRDGEIRLADWVRVGKHPRQVADGFLMLADRRILLSKAIWLAVVFFGLWWSYPAPKRPAHPVSALLPCLRWHRPHRSRSSSPLAPQPTERTGSRCLRDKPLRAPTGLVGRRCRLTAPEGRSGAASLGLGGRSSRIYGPLAKIDHLALPAARDHLNLAGANHLTTNGPHSTRWPSGRLRDG